MTTSLPAAKVRSDASYRTVSTGGASVLTGTNCIGNEADCRASRRHGLASLLAAEGVVTPAECIRRTVCSLRGSEL